MWDAKLESHDERHGAKACATRANVEKSWEDWDEVVEVFYNTHSRGCAGRAGLRGKQFLRRFHYDFADHRQRDYQPDPALQRTGDG